MHARIVSMHCVESCSLATSFIMIVRDVIMELAAWTQYLPKLKLGLCNLVSEPCDFLLRQLKMAARARLHSLEHTPWETFRARSFLIIEVIPPLNSMRNEQTLTDFLHCGNLLMHGCIYIFFNLVRFWFHSKLTVHTINTICY